MKNQNKAALGRICLICTTLIWGSSFVILKNALDSITPMWVLAIRFGGAAIMMFIACLPRIKKIDKQYIKGGVLMGICLSAAYIVQTYDSRKKRLSHCNVLHTCSVPVLGDSA